MIIESLKLTIIYCLMVFKVTTSHCTQKLESAQCNLTHFLLLPNRSIRMDIIKQSSADGGQPLCFTDTLLFHNNVQKLLPAQQSNTLLLIIIRIALFSFSSTRCHRLFAIPSIKRVQHASTTVDLHPVGTQIYHIRTHQPGFLKQLTSCTLSRSLSRVVQTTNGCISTVQFCKTINQSIDESADIEAERVELEDIGAHRYLSTEQHRLTWAP